MIAFDLAVEIISKGNRKAEMDRKHRECLEAGTRLVWFIDPRTRTSKVFTSVEQMSLLTQEQSFDGGDVLPGFTVSLRELFERANRGPDD